MTMKLFNRKKPEPITKYTPAEQAPSPAKPPSIDQKIDALIENQAVVTRNQQIILDSITALGQLIQRLAGDEELPEMETEPTEEELRAAVLEMRKKGKR